MGTIYRFVNQWFLFILVGLPFAAMAACDLYHGIRGYLCDRKIQKELKDAGIR